MRIQSRTRVGSLVERFPQVGEILGWYGVQMGDEEEEMTLAEVSRQYRVDLEDIIVDIQAVLDDDDDDDDEEEEDEEDEENEEEDDWDDASPPGVDDDDDWDDDSEDDEEDPEDDEEIDEEDWESE